MSNSFLSNSFLFFYSTFQFLHFAIFELSYDVISVKMGNRRKFLKEGPEALKDRRQGHDRKLSVQDEQRIVNTKLEEKYRSARFISNKLKLVVHRKTAGRVLVRHHLTKR